MRRSLSSLPSSRPPPVSSPFGFVRLAGERPIGSVPFHRADGGELLTGVEHPKSREEGRRSNLAMSARLLAFARTKKKQKKRGKKKELVDLVGESSAPWKVPVSFKCFCFSRWSLRFHFFCTLYLKNKKRKNKTKQNYEVTVKGTRFWLFSSRDVAGFREFYVLILLQSVGRIPQSHLWGPARHLRRRDTDHQWFTAENHWEPFIHSFIHQFSILGLGD